MKQIIKIGLVACVLLSNSYFIYAEEEEVSETDDNSDTIGEYGGYLFGAIEATKLHFSERKFHIQKTGHGFLAERANNLNNVLHGYNSTVVGDDNSKNGADIKIVNRNGTATYIQDKYCQTATNSVNNAFDNETGMYRYYVNDEIMQLEVPSDQYEKAVQVMKDKIEQGLVPDVTDPEEALNIVKKGSVTYEQAVNIAKAGTIDSLTYDSINGAIIATKALGISFTIDYALRILQGEKKEEAIKESVMNSLQVGGKSFLIYVLSSQLAKTGAANIFTPATTAISKVLGDNVTNALATMIAPGSSVTKNTVNTILKNGMLTTAVAFAVITVPDVVDMMRGRISPEQLANNLAVAIAGAVGSTVGVAAGGTLGNLLVPGVGTTIGGIVGGTAGGIAANWTANTLLSTVFESDAENMYNILVKQSEEISNDYLMTNDEVEELVLTLNDSLDNKTLKDMFGEDDREAFADNLIKPIAEKIVENRETIEIPTESIVRENLLIQASDIVYIH